jgi:bifunctional DNA-binding transcriptional regulator/antitoxin component of YhaV-PrlF toxin-antitoxin module
MVPAEARRDFNIQPGDKLLVLGDLDQGIAFAPLDLLQKAMQGGDGLPARGRSDNVGSGDPADPAS